MRNALAALACAPFAAAALGASGAGEVPAPRTEPRWQLLWHEHGLRVTWDSAGVVRRGDVVQVVVRMEAAGRDPEMSAEMIEEIRCSDRRSRVVRITEYVPGGGEKVHHRPRAKFKRIRVSDALERVRQALC